MKLRPRYIKFKLSLFLATCPFIVFSQNNLIPNHSFELLDTQYCNFTTDTSLFNFAMRDWNTINESTPDIINSLLPTHCFNSPLSTHEESYGVQMSLDGNNHLGLGTVTKWNSNSLPSSGEYVFVELLDSLSIKKEYYFEINISCADSSRFRSGIFESHLSKTPLQGSGWWPIIVDNPTFTFSTVDLNCTDWHSLKRVFIPESPNKYLSLGIFKDPTTIPYDTLNFDFQTWRWPAAFLFIDKLILKEFEPLQILGSLNYCEGDTIDLLALGDGGYNWSVSNVENVISEGSRLSVVLNKNTRVFLHNEFDTAFIDIEITQPLDDFLGVDQELCDEEELELKFDDNLTNLTWLLRNENQYGLLDSLNIATAKYKEFCLLSDTLFINRTNCKDCLAYIPTAFSPNEDGVNDLFNVFPSCDATLFDLKLFNRWGALIFQANSSEDSWDGYFKNQKLTPQVLIGYLFMETEKHPNGVIQPFKLSIIY